jgi:hypothetical protein
MFSPEQRRWRADKFGDLANYTVGALLIGQLLTRSFHLDLTLIGLAVPVFAFIYGNSLLKHLH